MSRSLITDAASRKAERSEHVHSTVEDCHIPTFDAASRHDNWQCNTYDETIVPKVTSKVQVTVSIAMCGCGLPTASPSHDSMNGAWWARKHRLMCQGPAGTDAKTPRGCRCHNRVHCVHHSSCTISTRRFHAAHGSCCHSRVPVWSPKVDPCGGSSRLRPLGPQKQLHGRLLTMHRADRRHPSRGRRSPGRSRLPRGQLTPGLRPSPRPS